MADDRITPAFGDLNPVEVPQIGRALDTRNTSVVDVMRESALGVFKKDAFQNTGPLKGIVLRVDKEGNDVDASSWIKNVFGGSRPSPLISVKARIPEIHATLPEPSKYGPNAGDANRIIDMYPSFVAIDKETSNKPVAAGDIVILDFVDRVNLAQPIYLGPVLNNSNPGAVGKTQGSQVFDDKSVGKFGSAPPPGDSIGGEKNSENQIPQTTTTQENNNMDAQTIGQTTDAVLGGPLPPGFHSVTAEEIKKIMPRATPANIQKYLELLNQAMGKYQINTPQRQATFLSQVAVESGQLLFDLEQSSGDQYEGRKLLGNTQTGDGPKFKGRGLIQLTGRFNYTDMTKKLNRLGVAVNLVDNPDLARRADISALIATQYFKDHNINAFADKGDIVGASRAVNNGDNGLRQRIAYYNTALNVLTSA